MIAEHYPLRKMRAPSGRVFEVEQCVVRTLEGLGWTHA